MRAGDLLVPLVKLSQVVCFVSFWGGFYYLFDWLVDFGLVKFSKYHHSLTRRDWGGGRGENE